MALLLYQGRKCTNKYVSTDGAEILTCKVSGGWGSLCTCVYSVRHRVVGSLVVNSEVC